MKVTVAFIGLSILAGVLFAGGKTDKKEGTVSFKNDVQPIIKSNCMPCHEEANANPSELSMDNYELLAKGGKNGNPWVDGKADESILYQKLTEKPPFDARMPLNSKKKIREGKAKYLNEEQMKTISNWIEQGAKNN